MMLNQKSPVPKTRETSSSPQTREHPFFFRNAGERLFGVLHRPPDDAPPANCGWVFCSPFGEERGFAQRFMVEWARVLCEEGYWVLRFDYRGYGDSEGLFEEFTAEDHIADIQAAIQELQRRSGVPCIGLCGLRLGATLAARASLREGGKRALILWEPIVNGQRFMDEMLRWIMAKEMANTGKAPRIRAQLKEDLAKGTADVVLEGHPLTDAIYQSIVSLDLLSSEFPEHLPVFFAQISPKPQRSPRREIEALRDALAQRGEVDVEMMRVQPPWIQGELYAVRPAAIFEPTLRWIRSRRNELALEGPLARSPANGLEEGALDQMASGSPLPSSPGGIERLVRFENQRNLLRGVLHVPDAPIPGRPALVMITPGFNCRTARYRLYLRLARDLARRGWMTLRFDPHGIGDSDGRLDHPTVRELYLTIENGLFLPDTAAGIDFLERECGIRSVILLGLCGGATTLVHAAARDERIAGIIPVELPLRYTAQADSPDQKNDDDLLPRAEADQFLRSYRLKIFSGEAWQRFFTFQSNYRKLFRSLRVALAKRLHAQSENWNEERFRQLLGPRAHLELIADFRRCLGRRIPILCVFGATYNSWYFAEVKQGLIGDDPDAAGRIEMRVVQDADPGFSLPPHTREFFKAIFEWLDASNRPWPMRLASHPR